MPIHSSLPDANTGVAGITDRHKGVMHPRAATTRKGLKSEDRHWLDLRIGWLWLLEPANPAAA